MGGDNRVVALLADYEVGSDSGDYLRNATREALRLLERQGGEEGFVLMVEGSLIDGMGHGNNAEAMQKEMRSFMSAVEYARVDTLVPTLYEEGKTPFLVLLDGITDVRNFGSIARTCDCAGVDAIILPAHNSVTVNADAVKTSAGALHTLPVCREKNITETLKYLKDSGIRIVCATEKGDMNYTQSNFTEPVCVVMGAEDTGIPREHLALCDDWVSIPQFGNIESLNVSVATGVILYEAVRQRHLQD